MTRLPWSCRRLRFVGFVVRLSVLVATGTSAAAPPTTTDVEILIRRGNDLRRAGKDQEALSYFQKAYDVAHTPRTAAQLGLCELALNYWLAADGHLGEALAARGDWIDRNRTVIQQSLDQVQRQLVEVAVTGNPAGATVSLNGKVVGTLPLVPIRIVAGQVRVEVTAPGYQERIETLTVLGGTREHFTMNLLRVPPTPQQGGQVSSLEYRSPGGNASKPDATSGGFAKAIGVVLVGAGVAAIGAGVWALHSASGECGAPKGAVCDRQAGSKIPGWALIGAGSGAGLVGGLLWVSGSHEDGPAQRALVFSVRGSL